MKGLDSFSGKMWLFFKGVIMGVVNKVPGISGGVVAFVMGFYEEFIYSLQKSILKHLNYFSTAGSKVFITTSMENFYFFLLQEWFSVILVFHCCWTFSFVNMNSLSGVFFGLIIGSIFYIAQDFKEWNRRNIIIVFMGVIAGISLSF